MIISCEDLSVGDERRQEKDGYLSLNFRKGASMDKGKTLTVFYLDVM